MPKIVKMTIRNLLRALAAMRRSMSVGSSDEADMAYFAVSAVSVMASGGSGTTCRAFILLPPGRVPRSPTF